jgi:hypothetical protein
MTRSAFADPWPGNEPIRDRRHVLDTTAITEPGRPTRIIFTLDIGYHTSGWFANSDYERCLHLSVSHPRLDVIRTYRVPRDVGSGVFLGTDIDTPTDEEARAWGRVFFRAEATKAWFEPAVGTTDPYRSPGVVHLRLYLDPAGRPIIPVGEVYDLRPFADGTSPAKILDGRAGADVR